MRIDDYEIEIKNRTAHIIKYYGIEKHICIPSYFDEYPVTVIANEAFKDNAYIELICFPLTLKEIGQKAFMNCLNIEKINIPRDVVKIGASCFENCKNLTYVKLPFYLKNISQRLFMNCSNLQKIEFPSLLETISAKAFANCKSIQYLNFPDTLKKIKETAILNCDSVLEISFGKAIKSFDFETVKTFPIRRFTSKNPQMCLININDIPKNITFYGYKDSTLEILASEYKFITLKEYNELNF